MTRLTLKPAPLPAATPLRMPIWFVPVLALLLLALDQLTKNLVAMNLPLGRSWVPIEALGDWLRVTHVQNSGAAFGMFREGGLVFLIIASVVVLGILYYYLKHWHTTPFWMHICLGLMLGGALGNLVDRIRFGYVVDFMDFGYKANWWPVFNVADSSVVIGVTLLALYMSFVQPPDAAPTTAHIESAEPSAPPTA